MFTVICSNLPTLLDSDNRFRFTDATYHFSRKLSIPPAVPPENLPIFGGMDVVNENIAAFLRRDILELGSVTRVQYHHSLLLWIFWYEMSTNESNIRTNGWFHWSVTTAPIFMRLYTMEHRRALHEWNFNDSISNCIVKLWGNVSSYCWTLVPEMLLRNNFVFCRKSYGVVIRVKEWIVHQASCASQLVHKTCDLMKE